LNRIPADIPAYAFGDASVLRAERGLALLAILFIAFVVLWRGMVEGELPIEISREGFKYHYREVAGETDSVLKELKASAEEQRVSITQLDSVLKRTVGVIESHHGRLAQLEGRQERSTK
jgi:hypothetical protein